MFSSPKKQKEMLPLRLSRRNTVFFFLAFLAALALLAAALLVRLGTSRPERPLPVLMYHHVVPDGEDCNDMTVTDRKSTRLNSSH